MIIFRVIGLVFREVWWWVSGLFRLIFHHLAMFFLFIALVGVAMLRDSWWVLALVVVPIVAMAFWARIGPVSYRRQVSDRVWRRRTGRWMRKSWPTLMDSCGLSRRVPATPKSSGVQVPGLKGLVWSDGQLVANPVLLTGQTVDDVEGAAERLRVSVQARRVRIVPNPALTGCQIVWTFGDPLAAPFDASVPTADVVVTELDAVPLGRTEDGGIWWLTLGVSTLVAGTSGSGKASLIWGLVFGVAPAIRSGLVQVHGIDLKGGMESPWARVCSPATPKHPNTQSSSSKKRSQRCRPEPQRLRGIRGRSNRAWSIRWSWSWWTSWPRWSGISRIGIC